VFCVVFEAVIAMPAKTTAKAKAGEIAAAITTRKRGPSAASRLDLVEPQLESLAAQVEQIQGAIAQTSTLAWETRERLDSVDASATQSTQALMTANTALSEAQTLGDRLTSKVEAGELAAIVQRLGSLENQTQRLTSWGRVQAAWVCLALLAFVMALVAVSRSDTPPPHSSPASEFSYPVPRPSPTITKNGKTPESKRK
jgi:hypothetical protein